VYTAQYIVGRRFDSLLHKQERNHVFKVGGVQFLGLGYYYLSTEDRSTQFGAVDYIIILYSSKSYVKKLGVRPNLGEVRTPNGCSHVHKYRYK